MSFTKSLSNEEEAMHDCSEFSCSRATPPTHLDFCLTLLPELRACASSARNCHFFWGKFLFLFSQLDKTNKTSCVWCIV